MSQPQGHNAAGKIMSMKNRTRHLPACSAVPQPTAAPRAPPPPPPAQKNKQKKKKPSKKKNICGARRE